MNNTRTSVAVSPDLTDEEAVMPSLEPRPPGPQMRRWPAYAIASFIGLFCLVVGGAWTFDHVVRGSSVDETGWIVAGATVLRVLTIFIALAAVQHWGRRVPPKLLSMALWGCAAAQLVYPVAEAVVKSLLLLGLYDLPDRGLGNMSATGWFNFAAVWLVFGIPGVLFVLVAQDHDRTQRVRWVWPAIGLAGGIVALFAIGALIS